MKLKADLGQSQAKRSEETGEALGDGQRIPLDDFQSLEDLAMVQSRFGLGEVGFIQVRC